MKHKMKAIATVFLVACLTLGLASCGSNKDSGQREDGTNKAIKIQTEHLVLEFPSRHAENLKHEELAEAEQIEEIFYMVQGDVTTELFRICFGNQSAGTPVGYLHTESGVVPVMIQVGNSPQNMDDETANLYFGMMECMNDVLNCIYRDKRFSEYMEYHPGAQRTAVMKYWSVDLPTAVTWEEITEGDIYRVSFFGEIDTKRIKLYTISIGDESAENPLGTMDINGKTKTVSVKIEGMSQMETMSETEQDMIYSMMDTINDVILTITQSEQFSAAAE